MIDVVLVVLALALLVAVLRTVRGPTHADRALAVDFGFAAFVAGIAVLGLRLDEPALLDLVLAATLVGFLGTVAIAKLGEHSTDGGSD
jgi:multicomponent Na+:H+ antiporter subunit F